MSPAGPGQRELSDERDPAPRNPARRDPARRDPARRDPARRDRAQRNDLVELGLRCVGVARQYLGARPIVPLAGAGTAVATVTVVVGGRAAAVSAAVPLNSWAGLLPPASYRVLGPALPVGMLAAVTTLLGLWLITVAVSRRPDVRPRQVALVAACWTAPFALGPPLADTNIFISVAHGLLARAGLSPYHHGPADLGNVRIVTAIDPAFRTDPSVAGPLTTLVEHACVAITAGHPFAAGLAIRVLALLGVVAVARLALELVPPRRAGVTLALIVANPAVLLLVVSSASLTGVLVAVLLAVVVAARARRWALAVLLCAVATALVPIAVVCLPVVIAAHAADRRTQRSVRARLGDAARDVGLAAGVLTCAAFMVPFGSDGLGNLDVLWRQTVDLAPSTLLGDLIHLIVRVASYDDLVVGARVATGLAAAAVIGYLTATPRARPLERSLGYALLAAVLLAPVVRAPWLLYGTLCLAATATGPRRRAVLALSAAACFWQPPGVIGTAATVVGAVAIAAIGAVTVALAARRQDRRPGQGADRPAEPDSEIDEPVSARRR